MNKRIESECENVCMREKERKREMEEVCMREESEPDHLPIKELKKLALSTLQIVHNHIPQRYFSMVHLGPEVGRGRNLVTHVERERGERGESDGEREKEREMEGRGAKLREAERKINTGWRENTDRTSTLQGDSTPRVTHCL